MNPQLQPDGAIRSVPITRWIENSIRRIPQTAADVIGRFLNDFMPELLPCEVKTRLCCYTDSFDNHFVVDFIPHMEVVMVATAGSGHAFHKFPMLGKYVVDRIKGKSEGLNKLWQ
jgi:sarcosine oxidase/L-pipecolate oxidase